MEEKKRFRSWLAAMLLFSLLSAAAVFFFPAYRPSGVYEAISSGAYLYGLDLKDQVQYVFRVNMETGESRRIRVPVYENGSSVILSGLTPLENGLTYVASSVSGKDGSRLLLQSCDFDRLRLETVQSITEMEEAEGIRFAALSRSMGTAALTFFSGESSVVHYLLEDGKFQLYRNVQMPEDSYLSEFTTDGADYFLGYHGEIWKAGENGDVLLVYDTGSTLGEGKETDFQFFADAIYFRDQDTGDRYRVQGQGNASVDPGPYAAAVTFDETDLRMSVSDGKKTRAGILVLEDGRQTAAACGAYEYVARELKTGVKARLLAWGLSMVLAGAGFFAWMRLRALLKQKEIVIPLVLEAAILSVALMAVGLGLLRGRIFSSVRRNAAETAMETCLQLAYEMRDTYDMHAIQTMCGYDSVTAENELPYKKNRSGYKQIRLLDAEGQPVKSTGNQVNFRMYFRKDGDLYPMGISDYVLNMPVDSNFVTASPEAISAIEKALEEQKAVTTEYTALGGWTYGAFLPLKTTEGEYPVVLEAYMMSDDGNRLYAKQAWPVERVLSALMAALLAAILLILWRAMHSLGILKQAALLVEKGRLGEVARVRGRSEAAVTAVRFNRMSRQIASQVSGLEAYREKYNAFVPLKFLETSGGEDGVQERPYMVMTVGTREGQSQPELWIRRIHEKNGEVLSFEDVGLQCLFLGNAENALEAAVNILQDAGMDQNVSISLSFDPIRLGVSGNQSRSAVSAFGMNGDFNGFLKEKAGEYGASLLVSGSAAGRIPGFFSRYHVRRIGTFFLEQTEAAESVYEVLDGEPELQKRKKLLTEGTFEEGVQAFESKDLLRARMAFIRVLAENPGDGAAVRYIHLCGEQCGRTLKSQAIYMETYGSRSGSV